MTGNRYIVYQPWADSDDDLSNAVLSPFDGSPHSYCLLATGQYRVGVLDWSEVSAAVTISWDAIVAELEDDEVGYYSILDVSDIDTLWQDSAATVAVTEDEDPVGFVNDIAPIASVVNFFDFDDPYTDALDYRAGTVGSVPYWTATKTDFWNVPDAAASSAGQGFTITGLCFDGTNLWASNHGKILEATETWTPSIIKMSLTGTLLDELDVKATFPSLESVQGIAYDTTDDTLWFVDLDAGTVHHIDLDGEDLDDSFAVSGVNGLCYDSTRDALWCMTTTHLYRYSKAGALQATVDIQSGTSTDVDHLYYHAADDQIYITDAASGSVGKVRVFDIGTSAFIGFFNCPDATAIEGIVRIDNQLLISHDGLFHGQALINKNQVQYYNVVFGTPAVQWSSAAKPTFDLSSPNGLVFDGSGDALFFGAPFAAASSNGSTFIMLVKAPTQAVGRYIYGEGRRSTTSPIFGVISGTANGARPAVYIRNDTPTVLVNATATADAFDNTWHVVTIEDALTEIRFRIDGTPAGTTEYTRSGNITVDLATLGGLTSTGAPAALFTGTIAAFFRADEILESDVLAKIEGKLLTMIPS